MGWRPTSKHIVFARPAPASGYTGWKTAIVLPSGSLNHADRPIGVVAMWSTVFERRCVVVVEHDAAISECRHVLVDVGTPEADLSRDQRYHRLGELDASGRSLETRRYLRDGGRRWCLAS